VTISTKGDGPITIYGVALETKGPGVTWETLGVAGSSIASMMRQGRRHLAGQVTQRGPDLIVYMTGGNELAYESLVEGEGELYKESYVKALQRLREGAPEASCLVLAPLDQARRERGKIVTKPELLRLVQIQHELALEQGCAFWDSWRAMGGDGGSARWRNHKPRYAWTDLMHLTDEGLDLIGQSLADAMLAEYDRWSKRAR
jgi:lysophospholipase L1-like esterase